MKTSIVILLILLLPFLTYGKKPKNNPSDYICLNDGTRLDDETLKKIKLEMLQGDSTRGYLVCEHYELGILAVDSYDDWRLIDSENGSTNSMYCYSCAYGSYNDKDKDTRYLYWLFVAARENCDYAKYIVEKYHKNSFTFADDGDYKKRFLFEEFEFFSDGALRGSGVAALKIGNYFKSEKLDDKAKYWYRIGAQNGNKDCMSLYAEYLEKSEEVYDNIRAEFWRKRAAADTK